MQARSEYSIPFSDIKNAVLGRQYELSLVFVGRSHSRKLNRTHRGKDKPTNVLSFELSKTSGEMFIDLETARAEAPKFSKTFGEFVLFLFIHGLLHLKGMEHSARMDRKEHELYILWRAKSQLGST